MNKTILNIFSHKSRRCYSRCRIVLSATVLMIMFAAGVLRAGEQESDLSVDTPNIMLLTETKLSSPIFSDYFAYPLPNYGIKIADSDSAKCFDNLTQAVEIDTSSQDNKIVSIIERTDGTQKLTLQLKDKDQSVDIKVYNMIGKKVADVHSGSQEPNNEYTIESGRLPNGVYLCVVISRNIRLVGKFIVSRG